MLDLSPPGGLEVKDQEDCSLRSRSFLGCLTKKKPCSRQGGSYGLYYFHPLQMQAFDGLKIIKPCCFRNKAFSL
jgi:hypothetical protein